MENVRIDKGVKRGPRKRPLPIQFRQAPTVAKRPLHQVEPAERARIATEVLDRYINGEQVAKIAPEYHVSDVTIYALLLREHQDAWKDIQTARALARLEKSQDDLGVAADPLSLARAREQVRSAQWELERLLSRLYAPKQQVTLEVNVDLGDRLMRAEHRVIEGDSTLIQHDAEQQSGETGVVLTQHVISKA
jgi:hypothetical protein